MAPKALNASKQEGKIISFPIDASGLPFVFVNGTESDLRKIWMSKRDKHLPYTATYDDNFNFRFSDEMAARDIQMIRQNSKSEYERMQARYSVAKASDAASSAYQHDAANAFLEVMKKPSADLMSLENVETTDVMKIPHSPRPKMMMKKPSAKMVMNDDKMKKSSKSKASSSKK